MVKLKAKYNSLDLKITRAELDKGTFKNVTPTYLTNQVDGSDGFTIVGTASENNRYDDGCHYCYTRYIKRWDYTIDLTDYKTISYYARMNALHGQSSVVISDGLNNSDSDKIYTSSGLSYHDLTLGEWTKIEVDVSEVAGVHIVSFTGGYVDQTGYPNSSTSICDIIFYHK